MTEIAPSTFQFGPFTLEVRERILRSGSDVIQLNPKEFDTLCVLVRGAGRLLTKDEIIAKVWPDSCVADGSLTRNISVLRKALGDGFIQTVPKSGYRFVGNVTTLDGKSAQVVNPMPDNHQPSSMQNELGDSAATAPPSRYAGWALVVIVLVAMTSFGTVLFRKTSSADVSQASNVRLLVLAVENLTGKPDQDYLTDGLTEEIIGRIGKTSPQHLTVIAPTTTMRLKSSAKSPIELGNGLSVEYVLTSTFRRWDRRVKLSVQLIRVADKNPIWAADYEREDQNLFGISNEIAVAIAPLLLPSKQIIAPVTEEGTTDSEAYEDYLRGRYFWNKRVKEDVATAQEYFSKAIARDPRFAKAYSGLADSYIVLAGGHMLASVAFGKAQESAEKAIFLDNTLAEPHNSLAYVMYAQNWDWTGAEREFKRALELNPQYAVAHHWYFIYLTSMKRFPEAISEAEQALKFDPLSQSINDNAAMTYIIAGQDERGFRQLQKAIELDPSNPVPYGYLGLFYEKERKYDLAAQQFQKAENLESEKTSYLFDVAGAYAREGKLIEAQRLAEKLEAHSKAHYTNPYWFVAMYTGFGNQDEVIRWLDISVHEHSCTALEINTDPRLDIVRSDPRFRKLKSEMHLSEP